MHYFMISSAKCKLCQFDIKINFKKTNYRHTIKTVLDISIYVNCKLNQFANKIKFLGKPHIVPIWLRPTDLMTFQDNYYLLSNDTQKNCTACCAAAQVALFKRNYTFSCILALSIFSIKKKKVNPYIFGVIAVECDLYAATWGGYHDLISNEFLNYCNAYKLRYIYIC